MFDVKADNLFWEATQAIRVREKHTTMSEDLIKQYHGSSWREGCGPDVESHENHAFDMVVNTHPFLIYTNPQVNVESKRPKVQRELAGALKHGLNRWIRDVKFADVVGEVALDTMFDFGVLLVTLTASPGHENKTTPPLRPNLERISPRKFFIDPQCHGKRKYRFIGHELEKDLEDLKSEKEIDPITGESRHKYDQAVVAKLTADADGTESGRPSELMRSSGGTVVPRNRVRLLEVYVPEHRQIFTLSYQTSADGDRKEGVFVRKPRAYFGPRWGPYILFGIYAIPDQVYPLPPLAITATLVDEINAQIDQVSDQADLAKQLTFVNGANSVLKNAVLTGRNGEVYGIPGFSKDQIETITLNGPSLEQMDYVDRLRQRLDRKSGITEFQRGNVTGDATAAENNLAAHAADIRRKFMQRNFRQDVVLTLETAAWFMCNSDNVVFPLALPSSVLDGEDGDQDDVGEMEDALFLGGIQPGQEDFNWHDLEITIEPYSMEMVDQEALQKRIQTAFALVLQAAPIMPQINYVNWKSLLDDLFEAINIKDGRKYINFERLEQMIKMRFEAGQPMGIPGLDGAAPAPSRQLAKRGNGPAGGQMGDPGMVRELVKSLRAG